MDAMFRGLLIGTLIVVGFITHDLNTRLSKLEARVAVEKNSPLKLEIEKWLKQPDGKEAK